ncbi:uncharacterized protein LOC123443561 isoform X2 [Hordeum vulgare subsp. vulgare]|uniref:uncharacterized protein LOC123443561 isoform X2 n=1 Tax=Hordeum vulgare subsp. vulgare TaxID=112509 RepID=UPI00162BA44A|nr:uncharacterized protein LOC123443561 isoform X2 [Hordeum vulgare subsp. vulgare]
MGHHANTNPVPPHHRTTASPITPCHHLPDAAAPLFPPIWRTCSSPLLRSTNSSSLRYRYTTGPQLLLVAAVRGGQRQGGDLPLPFSVDPSAMAFGNSCTHRPYLFLPHTTGPARSLVSSSSTTRSPPRFCSPPPRNEPEIAARHLRSGFPLLQACLVATESAAIDEKQVSRGLVMQEDKPAENKIKPTTSPGPV